MTDLAKLARLVTDQERDLADLARQFKYQPPTEATLPLHKAVDSAFDECAKTLDQMFVAFDRPENPGIMVDGWYPFRGKGRPKDQSVEGAKHIAIDLTTFAFASTILRAAPHSPDRSAALRCCRLARNAAHEGLRAQADGNPLYEQLVNDMRSQLRCARWQANAAIALSVQT